MIFIVRIFYEGCPLDSDAEDSVKRETYDCIRRGYTPEVLREIKGLRYFDDSDILFYWKETLQGVNLLKKKKVVNLTEMRRLTIGLVAIEMAIKERMGGEI
ncbi:MAG: hypothetical protein A2Y65_07565 [Deltaproteobacteria bacterium RBG_13_52_11]|nr:MAG: hypothetical protein A2Y65_07565 [Deltaproteobacteria bacterium RBG_13_52_11]